MKKKERKIRPSISNIHFGATTNTVTFCPQLISVAEATSESECLKKSNTIGEFWSLSGRNVGSVLAFA